MDDQTSTDVDYPTFPRDSQMEPTVAPPHGLTPSKAMATWALVLACLPVPILWAVSVGLGIAVLRRSKDGLDHGKKLVIGGFVVISCWIVIIATVMTVGILSAAERDSTGELASRGDVPIEKIRVGDCIENDITEDVVMATVEVIPCEETHLLEAYANFRLPNGDWPGQDEVDRLSEGGCIKRYGEFVGKDFLESKLDMMYLRPFEEGWTYDRGVTCLISDGSQLVGTLEGVAR